MKTWNVYLYLRWGPAPTEGIQNVLGIMASFQDILSRRKGSYELFRCVLRKRLNSLYGGLRRLELLLAMFPESVLRMSGTFGKHISIE